MTNAQVEFAEFIDLITRHAADFAGHDAYIESRCKK